MPLAEHRTAAHDDAERRARFLSEMEHELRTPVTSIASAAEILRDNPDVSPETRNAFLDAIIQENARLTRTLERLLNQNEASAQKHTREMGQDNG